MSSRKKSEVCSLPVYILKCIGVWLILTVIGTAVLVLLFRENTVTTYPDPTSYFFVNDYSEALSGETESLIQNQAEILYGKTKAQIVLVMVPDTQADNLEDYSYHLANNWGIGDSELDNGVLILFTTEEPHVRMEVGRGLEGCLNDAKAGRILDDRAVDAKDDGRWNEAAINTWMATAQVVYQEYGLDVPKETAFVDSVSEEPQSNTMADAAFPEAVKEKNTAPLSEQIEDALLTFWLIAFLPYIFLCVVLRLDPGSSDGGGGYRGGGFHGGGWSSGGGFGGGGGFSGGGGSFGGGGASR